MGVHGFAKVVSPKINVIAWLEFELALNNVAVQNVSRYTKKTSFPIDGRTITAQKGI